MNSYPLIKSGVISETSHMLHIQALTPLEHYRLRVAQKPEIVEDEIAPGLVCFSVMKGVGNADTYQDPFTREARGIVFSAKTGHVVSRPFHKFFNVNERESTQVHKLDWKKVVRVMDKRDGSMIHPVAVDHIYDIRFKSKKTLESDVAIAAGEYADENEKYMKFCEDIMLTYCATPIFEWTSPNQRIVLGYAEPELKLLHIRSNQDGKYWSLEHIRNRAKEFDIPICDEVVEFTSFEEILKAAETREEIEGWVIQFEDGDMVKIKTNWYMARHRAFTFYRERDIVRLIMDEMVDDVKAMFVKDGVDITSILEIEHRFAEDMRLIIEDVEFAYENHKHLTAREVAAKFKGDEYFGLIMSKYNGKEPRYLDYFEKNVLKENYGLNTLMRSISIDGAEEDEQANNEGTD